MSIEIQLNVGVIYKVDFVKKSKSFVKNSNLISCSKLCYHCGIGLVLQSYIDNLGGIHYNIESSSKAFALRCQIEH